ncbi:MAG TPA: PQQ-binding-like beta-propeller repeat protein, partial [Chthonomonadales bacterium]|nr:PQQ-binding-like beta-propeller repeat protein [Chthonomonadales bacterium]
MPHRLGRYAVSMAALSALYVAAFALSAFADAAPKPTGLDWPQWRGVNRDGVWREQGLIERFAGSEVRIKWRVPISNGYSGPTVADGRVYVTDYVATPKPQEQVHCFDWETGRKLWSHTYDVTYGGVGYPNGPRASVTVFDGRAYALGAVGHLSCLEAITGRVLWSKDLDKEYNIRMPEWGIAAAPLIEGDLVIVHIGGSNRACLVAFDKKSGQERWRALEDRASYSAPIVIRQAGKRVLV